MPKQDFFNESSEQSRVKAAIVAEYFWIWAKVIMSEVKKRPNGRIAYIDLFAGPGRYQDGTSSTPLLVLQQAVEDQDMCQRLVTMFNDVDSKNIQSLENAITALPNIDALKFKPKVYNQEVGEEIVKLFESVNLVPTLFFVDPWGYKGLSLKLINSVLKDWGCDCIFFFNYNRIRMGLNNEFVKEHIDALFGDERANELRQRIDSLPSAERETAIVEEISQALKEMGGRFVLPFRFRNVAGTRTTHHLIFVSKHFKGYHLMKRVMVGQSSSQEEGVSSFEYNPATIRQPFLFEFVRVRPLNELKQNLLQDFAGQTSTMWQIYEAHSVDTPYTDKNYKEALRQLEAEGLIIADPPASKRRKYRGEISFADAVSVTFPKK